MCDEGRNRAPGNVDVDISRRPEMPDAASQHS